MESGNKLSIPQETVKLVFIGWSHSGKSALTDVILGNAKRFKPKNKAKGAKRDVIRTDYLENLKPGLDLNILDYSCDELSRLVEGSVYEDSNLAVFTLDVSADNYEEQLEFLKEERKKLQAKSPEVMAFLVLTKNDLPRKINNDEVKALKEALGLPVHFSSALIVRKGEFQESESIDKFQHHVREAVKRVAARRPIYEGQAGLEPAQYQSSVIQRLVMPIELGKLSESQQKINLQELKNYFIKHPDLLHVGKNLEAKFKEIVAAIWAACDTYEIVLNSDLSLGMSALVGYIQQGLKIADLKLEEFREAALKWGAYYKSLEIKAARENVSLLSNQERGILRGLRDHDRIPHAIWCEDLDLKEVLKGLIIEPEVLETEGTYVLPPTSLTTADFVFNYLDTILKKKLDKPFKLLIPVQTGGHWRCIQVSLDAGVISSASLWDSMGNRDLTQHYSYQNMVKAVEKAQKLHHPEKKVSFKAEAAGIQVNGWSCGDYVSQKCLQAFPGLEDPFQKAVRDADSRAPLALRAAIINRILENNPEQKAKYKPEPVPAPLPSPRPQRSGFMPNFGAAPDDSYEAAAVSSAGLYGVRGDPDIADKMFLIACEKVENWTTSEIDPAKKAFKVNFQDAMTKLKEKIHDNVLNGSMTTIASTYAAQRAAELSNLVVAGKVTGTDIDKFHRTMINLSDNYSWRVIVGAVVGAVVGVVVGAMIAATCGPLLALSALYLASQAAILGSVFFGTLGVALGAGVGIWRTIQNDPVMQVADAAAAFKQSIPLQPFPGAEAPRPEGSSVRP